MTTEMRGEMKGEITTEMRGEMIKARVQRFQRERVGGGGIYRPVS